MVFVLAFIFSLLVFIIFGVFRRLNEKWREISHFSLIYLLIFFVFIILSYILAVYRSDPQYLNLCRVFGEQVCISLLFYLVPTFVIAFLLYPFKIIKRNRILIWFLLCYILVVVGGYALINILVAFSNM